MSPSNTYLPGTFNWADLATSDAKSAIAFYSSLFHWTARDISVGSGIFTMLFRNDKAVASLYQLSQQQRAQGIPSHWMAYVAVASTDDTAAQVTQLGGQVLVAPFDILDLGRMALLLDPTGAPFAIWQAERHEGSQLVDQPGTIAWNDLMTPDPVRAAAFYTQLFGWQICAVEGETWIFSQNGRLQAGLKRPSSNTDFAGPGWQVYFAVPDCEVSVATALALGGSVISSPTSRLMGRQAAMQDPQGATFCLIEVSRTKQTQTGLAI